MSIGKRIRLCSILLLLLQGCNLPYTPIPIPTIGIQPTVIQPFQGFGPTPAMAPEMVELVETIDRLFDPYLGTLPEDLIYEDSVYELLDIALREAYENCGYDLSTLGYTSIENPMTEDNFYQCITNMEILDLEGTTYSPIHWLYGRTGAAGEHELYSPFLKIIEVDPTNPLNYEPNYLNALMEAHPNEVLRAKNELFANLLIKNNGDPTRALEYIWTYMFSPVGTE